MKPRPRRNNNTVRNGQKVPFRKCTEAERNERVELLANYWDCHPLATRAELKSYVKNHFKLCWQMAEGYITRAKQFRIDRARMPRRETADLCISTLLQIVHSGTERGKLQAVAQLCTIAGIEAPKRIEQSGPKGGPIPIRHEDPVPRLSRERLLEVLDWAQRAETPVTPTGNGNGHAP